jgi:phage-related protein (TIGR01555 family)
VAILPRLSTIRGALSQRVDSWMNTLTGVGAATGKAALSFSPTDADFLSLVDLENLYNLDGIAARIAESVPSHALRQGFSVSTSDTAVETKLRDQIATLNTVEMLARGWTWGRLYGGGGLYLGIDDGRAPDEPVDEGNITALRWMVDVDRRDLYPMTWESDTNSPRFGQPDTYRLSRMGGTASETITVHHTRIVRFEGVTPTRRRRLQLQGWGESVLQRCYQELRGMRGAFAATGELIQEASQGVLKIKDLMDMMASDTDDTMRKRLALMDLSRSVARSLLLDADGESYERIEVGALTGVADILDRNVILLSGVSGIPVTVLMGQAPAGLNATGDSDMRNWYDTIAADRTKHAEPELRRVVRLMLISREGPTGGQEPPGWDIVWPSLWQPTPSEKMDQKGKQADIDAKYIEKGVLTPEEVALSRFRREGWSDDTSIDLDARRAMIEADKAAPADAEKTAQPGDAEAVTGDNGAEKTDGDDSVWIALAVPVEPSTRIPGGTPRADLHLTLAFLGPAADLSADQRAKLRDVVTAWARSHETMPATLNGVGRFAGETLDPVYVSPDCPKLAAAREDLVRDLDKAGVPPRTAHGFVPHVTIGYVPREAPTPPTT